MFGCKPPTPKCYRGGAIGLRPGLGCAGVLRWGVDRNLIAPGVCHTSKPRGLIGPSVDSRGGAGVGEQKVLGSVWMDHPVGRQHMLRNK